jgi:hypothetical protein
MEETWMIKPLIMIAVLAGLSACHFSAGIGSNEYQQHPVAGNAAESALAQGSIGTVADR